MEGSENHRGRSVSGSCAYSCIDPAKMSVSVFMGYLKGTSATIIFQKWGNMKFAYRNREFWCKGYYVDTVAFFYGQFFYIVIMQNILGIWV